jgi:hypothetical protein
MWVVQLTSNCHLVAFIIILIKKVIVLNCWKTINISKDYGLQRLFLFSMIVSLSFFIIYYISFSFLYPNVHFVETELLPLIVCLLSILPVHKILHCLPIWMTGRKAKVLLNFRYPLYQMIHCQFSCTLSKKLSIIAVMTPMVSITSFSFIGTLLFPQYMHLFAIFSALNLGLSVTDVVYVQHLWGAPRSSYLEDGPDGFYILTKEVS